MIEKGPTQEKMRNKGPTKKKNEGNEPKKSFGSANIKKGPGAYESLYPAQRYFSSLQPETNMAFLLYKSL